MAKINLFKSLWGYIRKDDFNKNREIGAYDVVTKSSKKANDLSPGDKIMVHGEKLEVKAVRVREGGEGFIYFTDGSKTNTSDDSSYEIVKSPDRTSASYADETPAGTEKNTLSDQEQNNSHPYNERTMGGSKMLTEASEAKVHMNKVGREISVYWIQGIGADGKVRKVEVNVPAKKLEARLEDFKRDPQNMKVAYGNDSGAKEEWARKSISKGVNDKYITEMEKELKKLESAWSGDEDEEYFEGRKINFPEEIDELKSKIRILRANNAEKSQVQKGIDEDIAAKVATKFKGGRWGFDAQKILESMGITKLTEINDHLERIGDILRSTNKSQVQKASTEEILLMVRQGLSLKEIAKKTGMDIDHLEGWLRSIGAFKPDFEEKWDKKHPKGKVKYDWENKSQVQKAGHDLRSISTHGKYQVIEDAEGFFVVVDENRRVVGGGDLTSGAGFTTRQAAERYIKDKLVDSQGVSYKAQIVSKALSKYVDKDLEDKIYDLAMGKFINEDANFGGALGSCLDKFGKRLSENRISVIVHNAKNEFDSEKKNLRFKSISKSLGDFIEKTTKDFGVANAGPVPSSLLARQDLAPAKKKKKLNKAISGYFTKLGIEPFGQAYKEEPTFDEIKEVADGETPDEGTGAIQNIEDLTGDGAKTKSLESDLDSLIERWKRTGRVAFKHPKKQTVSFNGGKERPYDDALKYLEDFFESSDKEKTQKAASYSGWEDMIITSIENLLEVTRSDAQGIVEAQEFLLAQEWAKGTPSYQVAKLIASKSSLKTQKAGKKTNYRGHTITEENGSFAVDDNAEYDTMEQAKRVIDRGEDEDKDNHDTDKARKVGKSLGDFLKKGNYDEEIEGEQSDKENYERLAEENPTDAPVLEAISNQEAGHKRALEILDKEKSSPDPKDDPENRKPEDESSTEKGMDAKNYHIYSTTEGKGLVWYVVDIESGDEFGPLGSHEAAERYIQSEVEKGRSDKTNKNMKTTNKESFRDYDNIGLVSPGIVLTKYGEVSSIKWIDNANSGLGGWKVTFKDGSQKMFRPGEVVRISRTKKSVDRVGKPEVELVEDQFETQDENQNGGLLTRDVINTAIQLRREMKNDSRIRLTLMQDFGIRGQELEDIIAYANMTILSEQGDGGGDPERVLDKSFTKSYTEMKQGKDLKIVNPHKVNKFRDFWLGK